MVRTIRFPDAAPRHAVQAYSNKALEAVVLHQVPTKHFLHYTVRSMHVVDLIALDVRAFSIGQSRLETRILNLDNRDLKVASESRPSPRIQNVLVVISVAIAPPVLLATVCYEGPL